MCVEIRDLESGADEGAEAVFLGGVVGAGGAVDTHVVGKGDRIVAKLRGPADEVLGLAGTAEKGKGGAGVEFGEDGRIGLFVMGVSGEETAVEPRRAGLREQ